MNAKEITPGLWQSPLAFVLQEWPTLKDQVDVVVLMAELTEGVPSDVPFVYFPIPDDPNGCASIEQVRLLAEMVGRFRVLTICHMGENRSGLLSALILVYQGMLPEEAVRLVQTRGPTTSDPERGSFWNPGFVQQVLA